LSYDAVLAPIVGRQILRRGRATFVKLGDKEVDCEPGFKLYLQTKLSNPHYPPEIQVIPADEASWWSNVRHTEHKALPTST
ncbi:hypothetical protein INO82_14710, partial [Staphylococcus aureus]|nr:hypothetical protein [Staphylococcus aureus]